MSTPAGSAARDQVSRLLLLVPLLHGRDSVRVEEAAALVGTTPAQVVADLKVLFMCGLPGGYPGDLIDVDLDALEGEEGDGVIRVSNADYLARPMRLTSTEASAVIVALRALRATADEETRDVVDRALAKLEEVAARGAAGRIEPGVDDQEADEARLRADLEDAVRTGRQVRLVYYVPTRDEESVRVVDPRAVRTEHGHTYLDGGATWPRRRGCSGWTGSASTRCSTLRSPPTRTRPMPCPQRSWSPLTTPWRSPCGCSRAPTG